MKLIRFGEPGAEQPGVQLPDGRQIAVDRTAVGSDYDESFFASGGLARLAAWLDAHAGTAHTVPVGSRLGPPIARPSKIICIGLNYRDHAAEAGLALPEEPVIFFKATSAVVGPQDPVMIPKGATKTDWEVELGVVIGTRASYVEPDDAMDHVAGYLLHNDYSERDFQAKRGGQWVKGKSCDTFAPLGPYLVTRDEIDDVQNLSMWLKLNGVYRQQGSTADMVFGVQMLVSYLSQFMTLLPGDLISTGTPAGVGLGADPPEYLNPGDVVEYGIEGLGVASQQIIAFSPPPAP